MRFDNLSYSIHKLFVFKYISNCYPQIFSSGSNLLQDHTQKILIEGSFNLFRIIVRPPSKIYQFFHFEINGLFIDWIELITIFSFFKIETAHQNYPKNLFDFVLIDLFFSCKISYILIVCKLRVEFTLS